MDELTSESGLAESDVQEIADKINGEWTQARRRGIGVTPTMKLVIDANGVPVLDS